jgi:hypothetical protein
MKKIFLITAIFFSLYSSVFSQHNRRFMQNKEYIDKERIPFFTNYLDLTVEEAEKFWPLYNEYLSQKETLFNEMRSINRKLKNSSLSMSETEAEKLNNEYIAIQEKQLELLKKYNKQFKKILPTNKVNKIYFAEREFRKHLLRQLKMQRKP